MTASEAPSPQPVRQHFQPHLRQRLALKLPDPFPRDAERCPDLPVAQHVPAEPPEPVPQRHDQPQTRAQPSDRPPHFVSRFQFRVHGSPLHATTTHRSQHGEVLRRLPSRIARAPDPAPRQRTTSDPSSSTSARNGSGTPPSRHASRCTLSTSQIARTTLPTPRRGPTPTMRSAARAIRSRAALRRRACLRHRLTSAPTRSAGSRTRGRARPATRTAARVRRATPAWSARDTPPGEPTGAPDARPWPPAEVGGPRSRSPPPSRRRFFGRRPPLLSVQLLERRA
jgi:hypothetical protein